VLHLEYSYSFVWCWNLDTADSTWRVSNCRAGEGWRSPGQTV